MEQEDKVELQKWQEEVLRMHIDGRKTQIDDMFRMKKDIFDLQYPNTLPKKIKLSNPNKLEALYYLEGGEHLELKYIGEDEQDYMYDYAITTRFNNRGTFRIAKEINKYGKVVGQLLVGIEILPVEYTYEIFTDFQLFTDKIIEQIKIIHQI